MSANLKTFEPYEPIQEPGRARSIADAPIKGFLGETGREIRKVGRGIEGLLGMGQEDSVFVPEEEADVTLEEAFPTQDEFTERALERSGERAPYFLGGGGGALSTLLRTLGTGFAGQTAEELGGGPIPQFLAELGGAGAPDLAKKILPTASNKELVGLARGLGLAEEEITPLIQGEGKQKFLSKLAERRGRSQAALEGSKGALDRVYGTLASSGEAKIGLPEGESQKLLQKLNKKIFDFPSDVQDLIATDFKQFADKPLTGESLINFYSDINSKYGKQGGKRLGILKEPIKEALAEIDPALSKNFNVTNKLYGKYFGIAKRLKPNIATDMISATEAARIGFGAATGNYPVLLEALGEAGARSLATEMLVNPRLQNLSGKVVSALNQNKPAVAERLFRQMGDLMKKTSPEAALELRKIDLSQLTNVAEE